MQNRYVGDAGDFGKYGLLRSLGDGLQLGVVWYLVPNEGHNLDGKFVGYLAPTPANLARFRVCDPNLYDALGDIVDRGERSVDRIRCAAVLPSGTQYFEEELTFSGTPHIGSSARLTRLDRRARWLDRALQATQDANVVFLDPDNGIESRTQRHAGKGPKYVYFDEIQPFLDRGQSVVVYHHTDRTMPVPAQGLYRQAQLRDQLRGHAGISALLYRRGSARLFFVVAASAHAELLEDRVGSFVRGSWAQHFESVGDHSMVST